MLNISIENADPKKLDRIINSALEEFSKRGFKNASTNEIVKNAEISKGLLFHYFGNKQSLYESLIRFSIEKITDKLKKEVIWEDNDFLSRISQIVKIKLSVTKEYPYIYDFMKIAFKEISASKVKEMIGPELFDKVYDYNIDFSLFRDDINKKMAVNIVQWTLEKFSEEEWKNSKQDKSIEECEKEAEEYVQMLRTLLYK